MQQQQHQPTSHNYTWQRQYGGGGSAPPPAASNTPARTPPPPTTRDPEVSAAKEDALRKERMRSGRRSTILAGAGYAAAERQGGMGASQSGSGVRNPVLGG